MNQSHISPGKVNLTVTVPCDLDAAVKARANKCGLTRNKYVLAILEDALARGLLAREERRLYVTSAPTRANK